MDPRCRYCTRTHAQDFAYAPGEASVFCVLKVCLSRLIVVSFSASPCFFPLPH